LSGYHAGSAVQSYRLSPKWPSHPSVCLGVKQGDDIDEDIESSSSRGRLADDRYVGGKSAVLV